MLISNLVAKVREKSDLSHEVHADNCTVTGSLCDPSPPAYSYRSVSSLLYLSSLHKQFEGGRFFFADRHPGGRAFTPTSLVEPRCGRLLAFTSGPENLHGVMPVAAGTRFVASSNLQICFFLWLNVLKANWNKSGVLWDSGSLTMQTTGSQRLGWPGTWFVTLTLSQAATFFRLLRLTR